MYKKFDDKDTIYFDVDDTLVIWQVNPPEDFMDRIVMIADATGPVAVQPHTKHIKLLKEHKKNGDIIVVWSQGGSDWAEAVVKGLKLEEYVDLIIAKPALYYDDLPPEQWMVPVKYEDL